MKTLFFMAALYVLLAGNKILTRNNGDGTPVNAGKNIKKELADTMSLNGQWFLQPLLSSDTAAGKIPVLHINLPAGTFSGNTGCNDMRGSFQKTDSSLVFSQNMSTTKMNCAGYDEAAFIRSLLRTNGYKFEKGMLILMFDATELSRWTRKPDRKIKMNKA